VTSKPKGNTKAARRKIRNVRRGGRNLEIKPSKEMDGPVGKLGHKPSQTLLGKTHGFKAGGLFRFCGQLLVSGRELAMDLNSCSGRLDSNDINMQLYQAYLGTRYQICSSNMSA
jgi:hypothetical protein